MKKKKLEWLVLFSFSLRFCWLAHSISAPLHASSATRSCLLCCSCFVFARCPLRLLRASFDFVFGNPFGFACLLISCVFAVSYRLSGSFHLVPREKKKTKRSIANGGASKRTLKRGASGCKKPLGWSRDCAICLSRES